METRLTDNYPNAYSDFYGSGTPCVFKSGPDWHNRTGPQAQGIEREAHPVYGHAIEPTWLSIGKHIYNSLDAIGVKWTSINPLAYADAGEAKPFCPLIISIGVKPNSLLYDTAIAAAAVIKNILTDAGFPTIEVAFVESIFTCNFAAGRTGPKLLSFNPLLDDIPDLCKPFTSTLGLSIAPLKYPHLEGTGALYVCLNKDSKRMAILTCTHVARPSSAYANTGMTHRNTSQAQEEFIVLGNGGYNNAIKATSFSPCLWHGTEACWGLRPQAPTCHTNVNSIPTAIQIVSTSISTDILIYFSNTSLYTMFFVFASVSLLSQITLILSRDLTLDTAT